MKKVIALIVLVILCSGMIICHAAVPPQIVSYGTDFKRGYSYSKNNDTLIHRYDYGTAWPGDDAEAITEIKVSNCISVLAYTRIYSSSTQYNYNETNSLSNNWAKTKAVINGYDYAVRVDHYARYSTPGATHYFDYSYQ